MAVWYRQRAEGEITDEREIEPHYEGQADLELLGLKAQGAADKGWAVEWTSGTTFLARKIRWGGVNVTREFWVE